MEQFNEIWPYRNDEISVKLIELTTTRSFTKSLQHCTLNRCKRSVGCTDEIDKKHRGIPDGNHCSIARNNKKIKYFRTKLQYDGDVSARAKLSFYLKPP